MTTIDVREVTATYPRWEVYVKHTDNITPYIGYIKALFFEDKMEFCIVRATGKAIETALRVAQMAKEEIGNICSNTKMYLHIDTTDKNGHTTDVTIECIDQYPKYASYRSSRAMAVIEILLSTEQLDPEDPGYERHTIKVQPIYAQINSRGCKPSKSRKHTNNPKMAPPIKDMNKQWIIPQSDS